MSAADFAQQQDLHALYSSHHGWLQGWLRHKLGNAGEAADLAQDTFVSVLTNGTAPQIREARPFLATIARPWRSCAALPGGSPAFELVGISTNATIA